MGMMRSSPRDVWITSTCLLDVAAWSATDTDKVRSATAGTNTKNPFATRPRMNRTPQFLGNRQYIPEFPVWPSDSRIVRFSTKLHFTATASLALVYNGAFAIAVFRILPMLSIRPATIEDVPLISTLIHELADYDRLGHEASV